VTTVEPTDGALAAQTDHGRTRELEAVAAGFRHAAEAGACAVLVTGEPGIGKSWLLATAAQRLLGQGARVLQGYALDLPGAPPAFALAQALNDAVTDIRGDPADVQLQPVLGSPASRQRRHDATPARTTSCGSSMPSRRC
jgi:predicted ATPase